MNRREMDRFWSKVKKTEHCWNWLAGKIGGYGQIQFNGKNYRAHRLSLKIAGIEIPKDKVVDHICRNRACVNPAHLRVVTIAQNTLENSVGVTALNKVKTHCIWGHEFTANNIFSKPDGYRRCLTCEKKRWAINNQKRKELRRERKNEQKKAD